MKGDRLLTLRDLAIAFGSLSNEQFEKLAHSGIYDYLLLWVPAARIVAVAVLPRRPLDVN